MSEEPNVELSELTADQKTALAHAFLERPPVPFDVAMERLRASKPAAAEKLIDVLRFHLVTEIPHAMRDFLAEMELYWRHPNRQLSLWGEAAHLVYHLYNYQLIESIATPGREELTNLVEEARRCFDDGDPEGVKSTLEKLRTLVEGGASLPTP